MFPHMSVFWQLWCVLEGRIASKMKMTHHWIDGSNHTWSYLSTVLFSHFIMFMVKSTDYVITLHFVHSHFSLSLICHLLSVSWQLRLERCSKPTSRVPQVGRIHLKTFSAKKCWRLSTPKWWLHDLKKKDIGFSILSSTTSGFREMFFLHRLALSEEFWSRNQTQIDLSYDVQLLNQVLTDLRSWEFGCPLFKLAGDFVRTFCRWWEISREIALIYVNWCADVDDCCLSEAIIQVSVDFANVMIVSWWIIAIVTTLPAGEHLLLPWSKALSTHVVPQKWAEAIINSKPPRIIVHVDLSEELAKLDQFRWVFRRVVWEKSGKTAQTGTFARFIRSTSSVAVSD